MNQLIYSKFYAKNTDIYHSITLEILHALYHFMYLVWIEDQYEGKI